MTTIAFADKYREAAKKLKGDFKWCYIGKDVSKRDRICSELGEERRLFLKDRLHKVAEELRKPFLDFVSDCGKHQKDPINWWASRFASKSPFITDFFLLVCYAHLVERLVGEAENLLIIVEDLWLFSLLCRRLSDKAVTFIGRTHLWKDKLFRTLRGMTYRLFLFGYLIAEKWLVLIHRGSGAPDVPVDKDKAVAIQSFIEDRAFKGGRFTDYFMGGLGDFLVSQGISVICPTYLIFPLSLAKKTAKNKEVWPIILDLRVRDILKCLLLRWQPELPQRPVFSGMDVTLLFRREMWEEFALTAFNSNAMYYYALRGFFSRGWSRTFIYHYENQPFEKMMCIAREDFPDVRLIGYRDTVTSWFYLSLFLAEGEKDIIPLPHRIFTIGEHTLKVFEENGNYPAGMLKNGGAWRYTYLTEGGEPSEKADRNTVLIATPIDPFISRTMILDIARSFKDSPEGIKFLIKCHPMTPFHLLDIAIDRELFEVVDEPIDRLLERADTVVYTASTVGLEFLVKGKTVIRYVAENLINMDSLEGIEKELYFTCYEGNCRDVILKAVSTGPATGERLRQVTELKAEYFGRVKHEVWLEEIRR